MRSSLNSLAIHLSEIEAKAVGQGLSFSLTLSNIGNATLLLPLPRITDLRLTSIETNRTCEWYTHMMVNSSGTTFTLDPAKRQSFDLHARFQDSEIEHPKHDVSNFFRWCTDMAVGRYIAQYRFTVNEDYFHPDSHARLRHLQREAEEQKRDCLDRLDRIAADPRQKADSLDLPRAPAGKQQWSSVVVLQPS